VEGGEKRKENDSEGLKEKHKKGQAQWMTEGKRASFRRRESDKNFDIQPRRRRRTKRGGVVPGKEKGFPGGKYRILNPRHKKGVEGTQKVRIGASFWKKKSVKRRGETRSKQSIGTTKVGEKKD